MDLLVSLKLMVISEFETASGTWIWKLPLVNNTHMSVEFIYSPICIFTLHTCMWALTKMHSLVFFPYVFVFKIFPTAFVCALELRWLVAMYAALVSS